MKNILFSLAMLVGLLAFGLSFTSCGPSAAIKSAPSIEAVSGLYNKLGWLSVNAQSGGSYLIEINADEKIEDGPKFTYYEKLSYKDKNNITIILRGIGANRTISHNRDFGSIFTVYSGVTLILDDNITIKGINSGYITSTQMLTTEPLVEVLSGGTLIMNEGSTITDGINFAYNNMIRSFGGGVSVNSGGTFIMKGGNITGNVVMPMNHLTNATVMQKVETFDANARSMGGGVYVERGGTFIKTGGTITSRNDYNKGNVVKTPDNNPINGYGHAVFLNGKEPKAIDITIGPEYSFNFSNGTFSEIKNEAPVAKPIAQPAAEPENNYQEYGIQNTPQNTPQEAPITPQEALQEYQAAMQKMQTTQREAAQEYQATIQKNPAAQQEALQKYQKTVQEAQQEIQKAAEKYREAMQKKQ